MKGKNFGLSQSHPWTPQERSGFLWSVLLSALGFTLLLWMMTKSDATVCDPHSIPSCSRRLPNPGYIPPQVMLPLNILFLAAANTPNSPIKRLPGFVQYLCFIPVVLGLLLYRHQADHEYDGVFFPLFASSVLAAIAFLAVRVNWWFYWDYPSRRTILERALCSVFYTTIFPLGIVMGFYRLLGVGNRGSATDFIADKAAPGGVLEIVPEEQALAEHARRMAAIRSIQAGTGSGRKPIQDKEAVSGSI